MDVNIDKSHDFAEVQTEESLDDIQLKTSAIDDGTIHSSIPTSKVIKNTL